jgi:hypothetical protein
MIKCFLCYSMVCCCIALSLVYGALYIQLKSGLSYKCNPHVGVSCSGYDENRMIFVTLAK